MANRDRMIQADTASRIELGEGIEATKEPLNQARHLPGYIYCSPEIYQLEKEKIFMKDWLCVARVEEIENAGDYLTFNIMNEPIIVARDEHGAINAFSNTCAHRGMVVAKGTGNAKGFTCDFHGWAYDLAGQLVGAPFMQRAEGFDLSACRLNPLRSSVWAGWIFVSFDADAPPLESFIATFERELGFLKMGECRLGDKQTWDLDCNWKLMDENNFDVYHVQATHVDTFGAGITHDDFAFGLHEGGLFTAFYNDAPLVPEGKTLFGKMPALKDKPDDFACVGHMPPNFGMVARQDAVLAVTTWPVSPTKTQLIAYQLFANEVFDRPDYADNAKVHHDFINLVLNEDTGMVQDLQQGVSSRGFRPGPMSHMEASLYHAINHYLEKLFDDR